MKKENEIDRNGIMMSASNEVASREEELLKMRKIKIIKAGAALAFLAIMMVFITIAWFSTNKDVGGTGANVMIGAPPFELKTTGSAGLYDGMIDEVAGSVYGNAETTASSQGIKWRLTAGTSEIENLYHKTNEEDEPDLQKITKLDSDEYGLRPGKSGTLQFSVVPSSSAELTVSFKLKATAYKGTYDSDNYMTNAALQQVENVTIINFLSSHILFFYMDTDNNKHLLTSEGFDVTLSTEIPVTLYWVWPATLREILDADIEAIDDEEASKEVRRFFFEHPDYFLKPIGSETFDDIEVAASDDPDDWEAEVEDMLPSVTGRNYNTYAEKYNNADQAIGDNANFLLAELIAGLKQGN